MKDNDTDTLIMIVAAVMLGPGLLAGFFAPVRDLLVEWHVLVTDAVLIPVADGVGLDLPRALLLAGVIGLLGLLVAVTIRRRRAARKARAES